MRRVALAASVLVLLLAVALVPMPWLVVVPGPTITTAELVSVEPGETGDVSGSYLVTSVVFETTSLAETVVVLFDDAQALVARAAVIPAGMDDEQFIRIQRNLFEESTRLAWAVGLREAGFEVSVSGAGAQVLAVAELVPAQGILEAGDVITAIDDEPIDLAADVSVALADRAPGDEVVVTFERDDESRQETVELVELRGMGDAGLGVLLRTVDRRIDLPVEIEVADVDVAGSSGGLLVALAAYDEVTAEDLARGRTIAGSGTIDANGTVGPVGGVTQKVEAAVDAGADVFVVASSSAEQARSTAGDRLQVVAVATLADAIAALSDR